jgi:hypothetical protein
MNNPAPKRFSVALSFSGEYRPFVKRIAENLANAVATERVLYDKSCESRVCYAGP